MILAEGEKLLRSWDCATEKTKNGTTSRLILTDKRLVAKNESDDSFFRQEIPIEHIKTITCKAYRDTVNRRNAGVCTFLCFLSLFFVLICSGSGVNSEKEGMLLLFILSVVFCVAFFVGIFINLSKISDGFCLSLTTHGQEGTEYSYSYGSFGGFGGGNKEKRENIRIEVNPDAADDIMEELGALLLQCKNRN